MKNYSLLILGTLAQMWATFAFLSMTTFAAEMPGTANLSLAQAIEEGMGESPTVKKYESAKREASWGKVLGASELVPHLEIKAQHDFAAEYESVPVTLGTLTAAVPEVYPRTSVGVEANWIIFNGFANLNHLSASQNIDRAAELESSRKNFEVRKKIELAYFDALAAVQFETVAEENVKTLQENISQVRFRLASGVATEYDVLRVEVTLSDATTELERTQDNVIIERKKLAEAMGKNDDTRSIVGVLPVPASIDKIKDLSAPVLADRQDFQAADLRAKADDLNSRAARGSLLPSVGLNAHYVKYENTDYPGEAYGGYRDAWSVGVFAKWDILDGGATIARAGMAQARSDKSRQEYQETVLTLPADFEMWKRRYLYSAHRFTAKNDDLKRSEESFRISGLAFQQGRKTITEVLESETDLFRARAGVVQSQVEAQEALVKLELTLGKDI